MPSLAAEATRPTVTVAPPITPGPPQVHWTTVPLPDLGADVITALGVRPGSPDLYVAISRGGRVYRSTDRRHWSKGAQLAFPGGAGQDSALAIAYGSGRFVGTGLAGSGAGSGSVTLAAYTAVAGVSWTSLDGQAWTAEPLSRDGAPTVIAGLVGDTDDVVGFAAGIEGGSGGAAVTTDGRHWRYAALPDGANANPQGIAHLSGGDWVMAGTSFGPGGGTCEVYPVAWRSADLGTWTSADDGLRCGTIAGLLSGPSGLIAIGSQPTAGDPVPVLWHSTDGATWTFDPGPFSHQAFPVGTTRDGTYLAASGDALWESVDGLAWRPSVAIPTAAAVMSSGIFVLPFARDLAILCDADHGCEGLLIGD